MSKIACAVIAFNAEQKLPTLLKSLKGHIDVLVLGIDAKTTDKTRDVAEAWAKKSKVQLVVHNFILEDDGPDPVLDALRQDPEFINASDAVREHRLGKADDLAGMPKHFARARNENWSHIPKDCDWGIWLDTDDEFNADVNLHQIAKEVPEGCNQVWFAYSYFRDQYGNNTTLFWRERLIRLSANRKWIRRLHEICVTDPSNRIDETRAWVEHKNRTDEPEKGERNFTTLFKILEEDPKEQWAALYLAHQYFGALKWDEAVQNYLKFVNMTDDIGERWQALIMCAKAYRSAGKFQESLNAATAAIREVPGWADPYYEMSYTHQAMGQYGKAILWYEEALKREVPDDKRLLSNPLDYDFNPCVTVHTSYAVMGQLDKARELLDRAIAIRPDPELIRVRKLYDRTINKREAITAGLKLATHLYNYGEPEKAREVLKSLPAGSERETDSVVRARQAIAHELSFTASDNAYENRYFLDQEKDEFTEPTPEEVWLLSRLKKAGAKRVLDIGIGNGQTAMYLASNGIQVVGLDVDPRRVKKANFAAVERGFLQKRYSKDHGRSIPVLTKRDKPLDVPVSFFYGKAEKIPDTVKERGPYDAVLLDGVLNRVRDHEAVIAQAESMAPRVLVTVPDGGSIFTEFPKGNLRVFETYELEGLFVNRGRLVESHQITESQLCLEYTAGDQNEPPVAIFCGPGWEPWTPEQIDGKGLGGSETAVVRLAEEMVKRGSRVMVYAEAEGVWNGVYYRKYDKWNPHAPVFMFVAWRQPAVFDQPIQAQEKVLWMHDTDAGPLLTEDRAKKIDSVWVMSRWHRSHMMQTYKFLRDDQMVVVGNGIDTGRFDGEEARENAVVYSSSPDRGLEQVLSYWPDIYEKTKAELRIFYGWENYDLMRGPRDFRSHILTLAKQEGVVWKGRVGQRELAREMMRAKALFYPGPHEFNETFCITALEAQAAGCVPVTRDNGALPETNKHGIVLPNDSKPKRWVAAIQEALTTTDQTRTKMRQWALAQTWGAVAERVIQRSIALDKAKQLQESKSA